MKQKQTTVTDGKGSWPISRTGAVLLFAATVILPLFLMVYSYAAPAPALFAPAFYGAAALVLTLRIVCGHLADKYPKSLRYESLWAVTKTNMLLFLIPGVLLAFMLPQMRMARQFDSDTRLIKELTGAREAIATYYQANGKYPERIVMPRVTVWTETEKGALHFHRNTGQISEPGISRNAVWLDPVAVSSATVPINFAGVRVLPPNIDDEGKWIYDQTSGRLFFACTGCEIESRRPLYEL